MSQIINRIKNILKTNYNFGRKENSFNFNDTDDELKKIIEELAGDYHNAQNSGTGYYEQPKQTQKDEKLIVAFRVLNISETLDFNKIKSAYKIQISKYHPDKIKGLSKEQSDIQLKKAQEINAAYSYLKNHFGK